MKNNPNLSIPAIVLACKGAPYGDINVVRSLGERGVHVIVLSEYRNPHSVSSRYCSEFIHVPDFTQSPDKLLAALVNIFEKYGTAPVVYPTADPDLAVLNELQDSLHGITRSILAPRSLIDVLSDKSRFAELAIKHDLPVPKTYIASTIFEVKELARSAEFPLIIKPSLPNSWNHPELPKSISRAKAILTNSAEELLEVCVAIEPFGLNILIQEYIPGNDDEHYEVHAYIEKSGRALASFAGRKRRIFPPHAGSGCFVESLIAPELERMTLDILVKIGYTGVANVDFKRNSHTGAYKLLEINPRVSHWNILATRSGVNLPWISYSNTCGIDPGKYPDRRKGLYYVNEKVDFHSFQQYQALGELTWYEYLKSLIKTRLILQTFQLSDPMPALVLSVDWISGKFKSYFGIANKKIK